MQEVTLMGALEYTAPQIDYYRIFCYYLCK